VEGHVESGAGEGGGAVELRGVLSELPTPGPGFAVDENHERLIEELRLRPRFELLRTQLERSLAPISDPRVRVAR
jgi:hypothetical protein